MAHHRLRDAGRMEVAEGTASPWLNPFVPDNYFQCCYRWPSYIFCDRRGEPTSVAWLAVPAGRRIHLRPRQSEAPPRVNEAGSSSLNIVSIYYPVLNRKMNCQITSKLQEYLGFRIEKERERSIYIDYLLVIIIFIIYIYIYIIYIISCKRDIYFIRIISFT